MLILQQRLRTLLLANPWFQDPVQVFIEDKDGIEYMVTRAIESLSAPAVFIQTATGEADNRYSGIAYTTERIIVSIVTTPATDTSGLLYIEGAEATIAAIHEKLVNPTDPPNGPKIHYLWHQDASQKPGEVIQQIAFQMPILIKPTV